MTMVFCPNDINIRHDEVFYILIETSEGKPSIILMDKDPNVAFDLLYHKVSGNSSDNNEDPTFIIGKILDPRKLPWETEEQTIWVIGDWYHDSEIFESFFTVTSAADYIEELFRNNKITSISDICVVAGEVLDWPPDNDMDSIPVDYDKDMTLLELIGIS